MARSLIQPDKMEIKTQKYRAGLVLFTLTMPGCGSWNRVDTGANNFYGRVKYLSKEDINRILEKENYGFSWDDGWRANVKVEKITGKDRIKIKRMTKGFRGYDWMIDSIIKRNKILSSSDVKSENSEASV